ncbi:hypothetical protein GCM10010174_61890 [Kutzneria viridogrisea]|uniref:Uncharacterized protein n=1 Tax=Kutzneria viridogrisea TaxID=47990 RepID=A0ABR6BGS5_9PSEU|nr:hypothetical protein [Kutzneria viridogrisea]
MQLGQFTEREPAQGDRLSAKENLNKPMIVLVREHRTGIKTAHNSDPNERGYKPDGGDGVQVDVALVGTNEVYLDVLWMAGAIVDNLAPYVGQAVPVKLATATSAKGAAYITVKGLDGAQLAQAQQWAAANPNRFEQERAQRAAQAAAAPTPQVPGAPAAPPAWAAPAPAATPPPAAPAAPPAATGAPAAALQDPAVQALLAQLAGGQLPPAQ